MPRRGTAFGRRDYAAAVTDPLAFRRAGTRAFLGLLPAALLAVHADGAPRGRVEAAFGVTPGGLVWTVEPSAHRLVLRDLLGAERAAFPVGDEGNVLGVADSGARVTGPTPDGFRHLPARSGGERRVEARYVFRFPDGSVRATVPTWAARGSEPAFLGDEAFLLRREKGAWSVVRVGPDGETPAGSVAEESVRRRVGHPSAPRLSAGADGVAILFPGTRGEAAVRLDRPGTVFVPDPLAACGEGRTRFVLPHPSGLLRLSVRTAPSADGEDRGDPLAVAELFDASGRLERSVALGAWNELFPLPDGGLLALDGMEAARFDDRFSEVSRVVMPLEEGADPAAAARVVAQIRRLEALGSRATGADWAELALLPGAPSVRFLDRARGDAPGALARLAAVGDGEPGALEAARALSLLLGVLHGDARNAFLDALERRVEEGGPLWLRRAAAFALLADDPTAAPSWALPAVAGAVAAGALDAGEEPLREEAFTLELAELVTAVDRARIDRIARERPEEVEGLLSGDASGLFSGGYGELRFHAPAVRFPRTLLDCAAGPPSAAGLLALAAVAEAAATGSDPSPAAGPDGRGNAGAPDARGAGRDRGPLAALLLEAQSSPDAGIRASARAVGPLAGLSVDAARFRSEVLRRPELGTFAFLSLTADRSLPPREWNALFLELFLGARAASKDPSACTLAGTAEARSRGDAAPEDRYCGLYSFVQIVASGLTDEEEPPAWISRERLALLAAWARSGAAPPELRLDLRLGRAVRGTASEEDLLEILAERELAPVFRRLALQRPPEGSARLAAWLERELATSRVPPAERGFWLDALKRIDAAAADRVAADAWTRGTVPLDVDDGEAGAWARALDPERVRESEPLRAALRRARGLPSASLEAATALARAGDARSAEPLATALLETCPTCATPAEAVALFGPLGDEGIAALARLAGETLPFGTAPLEALFELDAPRAEELATARLAAALAAGCVPEPLLPTLLAHGVDPFPDVLSALEARGCDRARFRPGEPVAAGIARAASTETGQAARRALASATSGTCRTALASLLGIEEGDEAPPDGR